MAKRSIDLPPWALTENEMAKLTSKPAKKAAPVKKTAPVKKAVVKKAAPVKKAAAVKEKPLPPNAVKMVEQLAKANAVSRAAAAKAAEAKDKEDAIRADLLALFGKQKIDGFKHRLGTVSISETTYADVKDMAKLMAYAKRKGNEDLLSTNVSTKAVRARWDDGKEVPGVERGKRRDLRFTPVKK